MTNAAQRAYIRHTQETHYRIERTDQGIQTIVLGAEENSAEIDFLRAWHETADRRLGRIEERLGKIETEITAWRNDINVLTALILWQDRRYARVDAALESLRAAVR